MFCLHAVQEEGLTLFESHTVEKDGLLCLKCVLYKKEGLLLFTSHAGEGGGSAWFA